MRNRVEELKQKYRNNIIPVDWKPCSVKPDDGDEVWILMCHWKGHFPSSFEIHAGEVESCHDGEWRVNSCDYDGGGSYCYYPTGNPKPFSIETFSHWCNKWEISVPEELISWTHDSGVE